MTDAAETGSSARILAAGTKILVEEGYSGLSMRKVAAMVGLSQAAIYRHYKDKAELVGKIVAGGYDGIAALVGDIDGSGGAPADLLAEAIRRYLAFALASPGLFKAVLLQDIGPAQDDVDALSPGVARRRKTFAVLVRLLERGMARGDFAPADPEISAQALWAAMFGLAARLAIEAGKETDGRRAQVIERHIEILLRGLRA